MVKQKVLGVAAILGALALVGAGCQPAVSPAAVPADNGAVIEDQGQPAAGDTTAAEARVFEIGGVDYAFDVTEIKVKKGEVVTINFTSNQGFHDWVVDEFNAATEKVRAGNSTSVTFVADQVGIFEYYCSVGQHRANGMVGNLIVE